MPIAPEIRGLSIVFRGIFNPGIFHPVWFHQQNLIKEIDLEEALKKNPTTLSDVAIFETEWFSCQVTKDRMSLQTVKDPYFNRLRDLTIKIFEILPHTPVNMFGINNESHFKAPNEDTWNRFGHKLVPKDGIWDTVLKDPGLKSVIVEEKPRTDEFKGHVQVKVEPSIRIVPYGLYIQMNDHYDVDKDLKNRDGNEIAKKILNNNWSNNQQKWIEIYNHISGLV